MSKRKSHKKVTRRRFLNVWSQASLKSTSAMNPVISAEDAAQVYRTPDPYLEQIFPGIKQQEHNVGRKQALRQRVNEMLGCESHEVILNSPGKQVFLFFNQGRTSFYFVRRTANEMHMSHTYPSKQIAQRLWDDGHVVFDIREQLVPA